MVYFFWYLKLTTRNLSIRNGLNITLTLWSLLILLWIAAVSSYLWWESFDSLLLQSTHMVLCNLDNSAEGSGLLFCSYTKLCLQNSVSIRPQQKDVMNGPQESTSPCRRLQWLTGIWHSINTKSWQLERREGRSLIACICLVTALVLHSFSHSLPAGMTPLRSLPSTDGPGLRCNQEQLAKFAPNK